MPADTVGSRFQLFALVGANAVSLLGNTIAAVAIPWFVLVTTGSAARTGVAAFFTTAPLAVGALFGGTVADRVGARTTSVVSDLASAGAIAAIPLLHTLGALEFWHLLALGFLGALFDAPGQAAREALLPELAGRAGISIERANVLWTTTEHGGYVAGAPIAGLTIALAGAPAALWLDAASFVVSALLVATSVPAVALEPVDERYLDGLVRGIRFVAGDQVLRTFLLLATVGNFLIAPLAPVFLPVYAREELGGAGALGLLIGLYGAGGLIGSIGYGMLARRVSERAAFTAIWVGYAPVCFVLFALPPVGVVGAALLLIGTLAGALAPIEQRVRQERTPPELRGRVFAGFIAAYTAVVPPAVLAAGLVVDAFGLRAALAVFALGNTALTVAVLLRARRYLGVRSAAVRPLRALPRSPSGSST
jgi:MFS family permease